MSEKIRNALRTAKSSAKRELGMLFFMTIFGLVAAVIVAPIIFVMSLLPDWTWILWLVAFFVWLVFGETISSAIRAYREAP